MGRYMDELRYKKHKRKRTGSISIFAETDMLPVLF